jgi:sugar lactone lactonase YvrE
LIISLIVVVALTYNNNPFNITTNIPYQTALAIPNVQTNNTNISTSASNDTSTNIIPAVNHPPVVKVGPDQTVNDSATVMLVGVAIDSEPDDKVSYSWIQIAGPAITLNGADTATPSFIAPSNLSSSDIPLKFTLTAKDDKGAASSPAVVTVTVKAVNQSPLANAGPDETVNPGHVISLDGTKSKDPDDDPLTYSWVQMQGPTVELNGADSSMATLTAPSNVSADADLIFKLMVSDSKNANSTDDVKVRVKYVAPPNQPPVANAGTDQTVDADDIVRFDGSGSKDPDNDAITYSWIQTSGTPVNLNGADTDTPSFTAPAVSSDTQLKFSLTVKDDKGDISSPAIVNITIKAAAPSPIPPSSNMSTGEGTPPSSIEEYSFVRTWGSYGTGDGQFNFPKGIAIDSSGNVYVADSDNHRIQKFTADGTFITKWDSYGTGDGQFSYPQGIAVDSSDNVYVAGSRIQKFTADGTFITKWFTADGQLSFPLSIAVDSSGNVYVADTYYSRIQKFTADGTFITEWGSEGTADGQFSYPQGIAVDSSGNVYVADSDNHRIQKFDSSGTFITKWGSEGTADGQFSYPFSIAIDSSDNVYAADARNSRIQKFDSSGTFITKWGSEGTADGQFGSPQAIAVDSSGNVYVGDGSPNHRIQEFAPSN